uniref:Uncharacterized protein n=1 Tax=Tanacetum cinerariifolium TaxID=118510 RepID=A0A6L2LAU0_TANCI|nr:hypothetical protein [Tanacetum cinerariifolium]
MEVEPDIQNMTLNEYLDICEQDVDLEKEEDHEDDVIQPLLPQPIHTTPPNDECVAPAAKLILDEILEEFGDEIVNVTMVNEEVDSKPTRDIEELKRLLAKDPQGLTAMGWNSRSHGLVLCG